MPNQQADEHPDDENDLVAKVWEIVNEHRLEHGLTLEDAHYMLRAVYKLMREAYGTLEMTFAAQQELAWTEYHIRSCAHCVRYPWPGIKEDQNGLHPMMPGHPDLGFMLTEEDLETFEKMFTEEDDDEST